MPLNTKIRGPLEKNSDKTTDLPFVFLVGNHSSGKSSFINHVLGRRIQTAGVAPTDDCFTVVAPGPSDIDQDGPALIGDPDMGFSNLRHFGPSLIHHTRLKIRKETNAPGFMMIDSPGMIDSPVTQNTIGLSSVGRNNVMDRGYDFEGVVRWFAERADVILLFFDPDKPGTTGETLSILVNSLGGMDHKLYIVLNKADQFKKIHDFARAYGSLCWNLSKVIPRKDLPRIYTMCLPVAGGEASEGSLKEGLKDLHQTRHDVVSEVMKAPARRIDNAITRLGDSINLLLMHSKLTRETLKQYKGVMWRNRAEVGLVGMAGVGAGAGAFSLGVPQAAVGCAGVGVLGAVGLGIWNGQKLKEEEKRLLSEDGLEQTFRRVYSRQISEGDEFTASFWGRTREPLRMNLTAMGLENAEDATAKDIAGLEAILEDDIPRLRRLASPKKGLGFRDLLQGETNKGE
ncbi:hypothetical protein TrST_g7548 [Triparma strigata]|uniref:Dynamin N-terminal domain-containing protein n=1 Tax=Triparma strigata TaxID=1606541 RepID=A0A9W6ZVX3_9STRA|nr:hypothetical protein TrST_g7548 [Triparma strigata]